MSYRNSGDAVREEIARLRVDLADVRATILTSREQCRALRSRLRRGPEAEPAPPAAIGAPLEENGADEAALRREAARLREALELATAEARRLRAEERRLRAAPVPDSGIQRKAAVLAIGLSVFAVVVGVALLYVGVLLIVRKLSAAVIPAHG